jgi:secondary thiamine-phosphate synthase enzyme
MTTRWIQKEFRLQPYPRGCHLVTAEVVQAIPELRDCRAGLLHLFICHTSASLTINENADPDVTTDMAMALNRLVPENWPWDHTCEGSDDMPAHVKATLTGASISIPVGQGRLLTGVWQGIYLCEHRNHGGARRLVATLNGDFAAD